MWCKVCNIETNESICPVCGTHTNEDIPVEISWCKHCKTPIINPINQFDKGKCPLCGEKTKYMCADLRPVFPEERLLIELLLEKQPNTYVNSSVWASNNRYYIDGESVALPNSLFETADTNKLSKELKIYAENNSYEAFNKYIDTFSQANTFRLNYLIEEAGQFIREVSSKFDEENLVISFSGGKDSTVTADIVTMALSNPWLVHIFGDTTLEFPTTREYVERFRANHPQAIF